MRTLIIAVIGLLSLSPAAARAEKGLTVTGARFFSYSGFTRVVFEIKNAAPYVVLKASDGRSVTLRAYEGDLAMNVPLPVIRDGVISGLELKEENGRKHILIHLDAAAGEVKDFVLRGPDRIVLDIMKGTTPATLPDTGRPGPVRVVIDPGHGGARDPGIVTPRGVEKSLTLQWAQAIKKNLKKMTPAVDPVLTRKRDRTLSLNDRAGAANAAAAAVFVSIHASAGDSVRVYIMDPEDEPVVRPSPRRSEFLGVEAESEQQEMLWKRQQAAHTQQSGLLGRFILEHVSGERGMLPIQAPLAVLRPAAAAAVVVEIGTRANSARTVEAISKGIERYVVERR